MGISAFWQPYPIHYRLAFAFSDILYPLHRPLPLQPGYHRCGMDRAYPVDGCEAANQSGWSLSPGELIGVAVRRRL